MERRSLRCRGIAGVVFLDVADSAQINKKTGFKSLMLMCFILTGLTLGPLMESIAIFGPDEAANQRYPAYAQWVSPIIWSV